MTLAQRETIIILDFGSQYTQLIARRVREQHVYAEVLPWDIAAARVAALNPRGIILSGGPNSVYDEGAPTLAEHILALEVPILGICYGMQLLVHTLGGKVIAGKKREYGPAKITLTPQSGHLFANAPASLDVWMSHGDRVETLPPGFQSLAHSESHILAAIGDPTRRIYALQFHPEVQHTPQGAQMLQQFLFDLCECQGTWTTEAFVKEAITRIRAQVGGGAVICGLSGGVDSAVTAALLHAAVGEQLTCIFVDTGLLRRDEASQVKDTFQAALGMRLVMVDAAERFFNALDGVSDPESKRRIIGEQFIRVFEEEAKKLNNAQFLAQGTIYPDVIESAGGPTNLKSARRIKSHHNVGGLPEDIALELVEPLRELFKDEVRHVGRELGLPQRLIWRHPFPGPGLAVRILGEVTPERVAILQAADAIFLEALWEADLYHETAQAFAVLLPQRSVGVMGDERSYANVLALRAVTTADFMTADWARLPYDLLGKVAKRIVNQVTAINRVVYDISSKPPATIEWE